MTIVALSRTCKLPRIGHAADFPGCITVTDWQQTLAEEAWRLWEAEHHILTREASLVVNYSDSGFIAPGPSAIYQYRDQPQNGIQRAVPAVWGLSVLDHIEAPVRFLQRAGQILRPQGLLFLTFAFWDAEGPDIAAGHANRTRIYDVHSWNKLVAEARKAGFTTFGGMDWTYHGNTLEDHSLASLVLTRR